MKQNATLQEPSHLKFAVLATDIVILSMRDEKLLIRFMNVDRPPFFKNIPGLPGGLIRPDETAEEAAKRIIHEKARLQTNQLYLEQLYTFSRVDRDPRGRVVAVAYCAFIPWEQLSTTERLNSDDCWWEEVQTPVSLAYDHGEMVTMALERLRSRITYTTLISHLLPPEFTLTQLEHAYATILGKALDKRNFRKKFDALNLLKDTGKKTKGSRWRPAALYRFKKPGIQNIQIL